jgi:hypothetical protein
MEINRSRLNTCLAKSVAYQQVGKTEDAEAWARELIRELQLADILKEAKPLDYSKQGILYPSN